MPFLNISEGTCFGVIDIIAAMFTQYDEQHEDSDSDDNDEFNKLENWQDLRLQRSFTVKCGDEPVELLTIKTHSFSQMKYECPENYNDFFKEQIEELQKTITLKMHATDICYQAFQDWLKLTENLQNEAERQALP